MKARVALIAPKFPALPPKGQRLMKLDYEPYGAMCVSAALKKANFEVRFWLQEDGQSAETIAAQVMDFRPDAVGFSVFTPNFSEGARIAGTLKRSGCSVPTVFGGTHATVAPEIVLRDGVDYALQGEGELVAPRLFRALCEGRSVKDIPGVVWEEAGRVAKGPPFELIEDLDAVAWPDRAITQPYLEYSVGAYAKPKAILMTSRGCASTCAFCTAPLISRKQVRFRDPEDVADEAVELRDRYGIRFLFFGDDEFFSDPDHVRGVCEALIKREVNLPFFCMGKIDLVEPSLLDFLARAGCQRLFFGLERPPGKTRWTFKARDGTHVEHVLAEAHARGIFTHAGLIIGFPDDTVGHLEEAARFVSTLPADYLNISLFTPYKGTALHDYLDRKVVALDPDDEHYQMNHLVFDHSHLTLEELQYWRQRIYQSFYLRRPYFWRAFERVWNRPGYGYDYGRMFVKGLQTGLLDR